MSPMDRYQRLEKLGEGSCGVVFKCRDRQGGEVVAVKRIRFDGVGVGVPGAALREVTALKTLCGHPHVLPLKEAFIDNNSLFLILHYVDLDLKKHQCERGPFSPGRTKLYAWQLVEAVAHCHSRRIAHRDIKPQNVLVDVKTDMLKLCDFSLAKSIMPRSHPTAQLATLHYRSPELLLGGESAGPPLDLWSLGCVIGEMTSDHIIFPGSYEIQMLMKQFQLLGTPDESTWPGCSALEYWKTTFPRFHPRPGCFHLMAGQDRRAAEVLEALLRCDPSTRLPAQSVLAMSYFQDLDPTLPMKRSREDSEQTSSKRLSHGGA